MFTGAQCGNKGHGSMFLTRFNEPEQVLHVMSLTTYNEPELTHVMSLTTFNEPRVMKLTVQCPGRFLGVIGQNSSVTSKSHRLHVVIFH